MDAHAAALRETGARFGRQAAGERDDSDAVDTSLPAVHAELGGRAATRPERVAPLAKRRGVAPEAERIAAHQTHAESIHQLAAVA